MPHFKVNKAQDHSQAELIKREKVKFRAVFGKNARFHGNFTRYCRIFGQTSSVFSAVSS